MAAAAERVLSLSLSLALSFSRYLEIIFRSRA